MKPLACFAPLALAVALSPGARADADPTRVLPPGQKPADETSWL